MKIKLFISVIASITLPVMCHHGKEQSELQDVKELTHTYSPDSVRNLMKGCMYISLRSSSPGHEGYALCIPTKQTEKCFFNVIISATPMKQIGERNDKENDGWKYTFKINDDSVSNDSTFHSLEEDSLLFESLYGCKARDIIELTEFCRQNKIRKVQLCDRNAISMETSEFILYNSLDCNARGYTHLSRDWYYKKKK